MTKRKRVKVAVKHTSILIILVAIALTLYTFTNLATINQETSSLINTYGSPALLAVSFFLDLIPQVISPVAALAVGILAGINLYYAIIATALGSAIGSIIGFTIGKKYMFDAVDIMTSKKSVNKLTHLTNKYGKIIIPIAAISPLPYLPVVLGAINFSKRNFIIFGLIPRAIAIAAYGFLFSLF